VCLRQTSHLENCTMFQAQVRCAKIALKDTNRHLSSTPCSHVPSFFPYVDCITVKNISCTLLRQIFIAIPNTQLTAMLLQLKLHFTSLLPTPHDINAALFTTTHHSSYRTTNVASYVTVTQCIALWVRGSSGYIASGHLCHFFRVTIAFSHA